MNCTGVRDRLPEHTLGVSGADAAAVDRHLAWCAACRKEARDLQRASASLAYALAPADPPDDLEDRVVAAVRARAGLTPRRRLARRSATLLLAAAVALAGLGGGAVIARRQPADDPTLAASRLDAERAAFDEFVRAALQEAEGTRALLGVLRRSDDGPGGGSVVAVVTEGEDDQVMVVVSGLATDAALPLRVELVDGEGRFIRVGQVRALDGGGGFVEGLSTPVDLTGFVNVLVRNPDGAVLLSGTLRDQPVSSPSAAP